MEPQDDCVELSEIVTLIWRELAKGGQSGFTFTQFSACGECWPLSVVMSGGHYGNLFPVCRARCSLSPLSDSPAPGDRARV